MQQSGVFLDISKIKLFSPSLFKRWCKENSPEVLPVEYQGIMLILLIISKDLKEDESLEIQIADLLEIPSREEMLVYLTTSSILYSCLFRVPNFHLIKIKQF